MSVEPMKPARAWGMLVIACAVLTTAACSQSGNRAADTGVESATAQSDCSGFCAGASTALTVSDVETVLARAINEASARGARATIAVVDRVGNVLAVYRMTGAAMTITATTNSGAVGGLEGVSIIPDTLAAISKAVTAAFLSSEGNAFSTRTASQIVQENFTPGEEDQPSGPLFGVQFSQLACSDINQRFSGVTTETGPKRAPLGLAADPGGLPLYKSGTPVGAVGVMADGVYGRDRDPSNIDSDTDELIALAASYGLAAPLDRRADRITAGGKTLRFSDAGFANLSSAPGSAPAYSVIGATSGSLAAVTGYYDGTGVFAGAAFTQAASGVRADTLDFDASLDAFVLVDRTNTERFRPSAGADAPGGLAANALTAAEVDALLSSALRVANEARAQIRRPVGTPARVSISVVDSSGAVRGIVRSRDAPVFGVDVSVQKARSAAFFSRTGNTTSPAVALRNLPDPVYLNGGLLALTSPAPVLDDYVSNLQSFTNVPRVLESDGVALAVSARALGNLARPHFPDGPSGGPAGPLSKPGGQWSVLSTGLQLDVAYNAIIHHVGYVSGALGTDVGTNCTGSTGLTGGFTTSNAIPGLANGLQIFPGGVPIYRGSVLIGAIGVSGDGVDQDDMIALLGVQRAQAATYGSFSNAPTAIRADTLAPQGVKLRYVSCPYAPFTGSSEQNACGGV